jgi:hypothetical protein
MSQAMSAKAELTPRVNIRSAALGAAVALLGWAAVAAFVFHLSPWRGADRIKHLAWWPPDCRSIEIARLRHQRLQLWPRTSETAIIECRDFGPLLVYARFPDRAALRNTLSEHPPKQDYCVSGTEVVVAEDYKKSDFIELCKKLEGRVFPPNLPLHGGKATPEATGRARAITLVANRSGVRRVPRPGGEVPVWSLRALDWQSSRLARWCRRRGPP